MKMLIEDAVTYRTPLPVIEIMRYPNGDCFPMCPRCGITLTRAYQKYCDRCGQCLDWKGFSRAKVIRWEPKED